MFFSLLSILWIVHQGWQSTLFLKSCQSEVISLYWKFHLKFMVMQARMAISIDKGSWWEVLYLMDCCTQLHHNSSEIEWPLIEVSKSFNAGHPTQKSEKWACCLWHKRVRQCLQVEELYGRSLYIWNWKERKLMQEIDVGAEGAIPLEVGLQ